MVRNVIADFKETLAIIAHARSMLQNHGVDYTLAFLQHLSIQAQFFYPADDVSWDEYVMSCARSFRATHRADTEVSSRTPEDPNLFLCHHVNVTPNRVDA